MYSDYKSIQILISLLKKYGIKDIIMSPGGSDIPLIHSIEMDDFFTCYSVVDERSAAYFAMGVAQARNSTSACVCTSGSAVCNYLPGITEAYYQNVPVVAITSDKNQYYQGQLETQKIDQINVFNGVIKKSVNLPVVKDSEDEWLCNRLVNEALLALTHHGKGPAHINVPVFGSYDNYNCKELPDERKINITSASDEKQVWCNFSNQLVGTKRVMVVVGQDVVFSGKDIENINSFYKKYNCIFAVEHLSNLNCDGCVHTYPLSEMSGSAKLNNLKPDIVISIGNNLAAYSLKPFLRAKQKDISNWLVSESGEVRDAYKCLKEIFECSASRFFENIISCASDYNESNHEYYNAWKSEINSINFPGEFEFSNFYVAQRLSNIIPVNSILHLAILNSTRVMQFFDLALGVRTYSNVGTLGIDGCFSTFAGQAATTDELAFLLIGDLSFFYDMNAAGLRSISNNVRIILLNNGGGSEFHFFMGKDKIPTIDRYICAEHSKIAEGWIKSLGYDYYSASSKEELDAVINKFGEKSERPMLLEVFTKMNEDSKKTRTIYDANKSTSTGIKEMLKSTLSDKQVNKLKTIMLTIKGR